MGTKTKATPCYRLTALSHPARWQNCRFHPHPFAWHLSSPLLWCGSGGTHKFTKARRVLDLDPSRAPRRRFYQLADWFPASLLKLTNQELFRDRLAHDETRRPQNDKSTNHPSNTLCSVLLRHD